MKINFIVFAFLLLSSFSLKVDANNLFSSRADTTNLFSSKDNTTEEDKPKYLSGSLESNSIVYVDDVKAAVDAPNQRFRTNNYLKLDYNRGKFAAGAQMEIYGPALLGYPEELGRGALTNFYLDWSDDNFSVTAGTFYDQFGSGLLFRSWEDRALGINNAIIGTRFSYDYKNILRFKALYGMPRFGDVGLSFGGATKYDNKATVLGADLIFSLSELLKLDNTSLSFEVSMLHRYQDMQLSDYSLEKFEDDVNGKYGSTGYSARVNFAYKGFSTKLEYVDGGYRYFNIPIDGKLWQRKKANAQIVELAYNAGSLGVNLTARRLEWMKQDIVWGNASTSNMINYIPAMSNQYTYLLTNLHPYSPQLGTLSEGSCLSGELGGQIDIFYHFRRGTALGGKRGMKVHANFSTYYALNGEGLFDIANITLRDFSFDIEKQVSRSFKMNFLYSMYEYNPTYGAERRTYLYNTFVLDMLYKFTSKFSTRLELQYLTTLDDSKDWLAALLEINFAPSWSIFASEMYNHGSINSESKPVHYYNFGVSYAKSKTRLSLSYGRNRAGYICSGGVCRQIDAYTGLNFTLTSSF